MGDSLTVFELLLADQCFPFTLALMLMALISLIEGVALVFAGGAVSHALDSLIPADLGVGTLADMLGWIRVGQVPVLMLVIIFLTSFGLVGICAQWALHEQLGRFGPAWLVSIPAAIVALPVMHIFGGVIHQVLPTDETAAISEADLVGKVAVIVDGVATRGVPTQARVSVQDHQHYVLVEPLLEQHRFVAGDRVLLETLLKPGAFAGSIAQAATGETDRV